MDRMSYHNAEAIIDPQFESPGMSGRGLLREGYEDDPRWPKTCAACGRPFHPEDHWQVNEDRLYHGTPDGKLYRLRDLPPGAIWRAPWMEDIEQNPYADPSGAVYALMMPSGVEWMIYGPASGKGRWKVTGQLPRITVHPSVHQVGEYHGHVKDGVISDDVEGRVFPRFPSTA